MRKMASATAIKGTRKTYSFEEREILISLINKYEDVEDRKPDPNSMCKRKSAWCRLAEEYNSIVGPQGTRSAIQLRRCWENMKACKRNREEQKLRVRHVHLRDRLNGQNVPETPSSTGNVGLPPNIVFEPKDSEPFTLQSVTTTTATAKKWMNLKRSPETNDSDADGNVPKEILLDRYSCKSENALNGERSFSDNDSSIDEAQCIVEDATEKEIKAWKAISTQTLPQVQERKVRKVSQREEELHVLALTEAQMRVDIAVMQKEEAKVKLDEAHFRKEEARLRMLFITYKLDKIRED